MKIGMSLGPALTPAFTGPARSGVGPAFKDCLVDISPVVERPPLGMTSVLAPGLLDQEVRDREARDERSRKRADGVLRLLGRLQASILNGGDAGATMIELGDALSELAPSVDPRLASLLEMVEVRACVEIARNRS